jgi:outer membrane protein assembly factor BamD
LFTGVEGDPQPAKAAGGFLTWFWRLITVGPVKRSPLLLALIAFALLALPQPSPAPLIYRPGEGWTYEPVGGEGNWRRSRAKDQFEIAQAAFTQKDYSQAAKAARRVVQEWPQSDYAPQAQFLIGRCYEVRHQDEKAFKEYQKLLHAYPKVENYEEILQRQYGIGLRFLGGQWFKLWGYVPFFPSMDKTAGMFEKVVRTGPFSQIAPHAQLRVGAAHEKAKEYPLAVKAYDLAADRYFDRPVVAADAVYRSGISHYKQAQKAEYDQGAAGRAIATFTDFITLFPGDQRVPDAKQRIANLKQEQARGSFEIARYYEKHQRWSGAIIYYNEAWLLDPESRYGGEAKRRVEALKPKAQPAAPPAK